MPAAPGRVFNSTLRRRLVSDLRRRQHLADIEPEIAEELVVAVPGISDPWGALWVIARRSTWL